MSYTGTVKNGVVVLPPNVSLPEGAAVEVVPRIRIIPLTSGLLQRGLDLMRSRSDKDWSLTDCTSFVAMEEADLEEAPTGDQHFEQAGFKALLKV